MGRLKILLSAYSCEPNRGSEPGVGWEWAVRLAKVHDVLVITRSNNRHVIEAELGTAQQPDHPRFLYVDLPQWVMTLKKHGIVPLYLYYLLWQLAARLAASKHACDRDVVHHVTFNGFRFPGAWWNWKRPVVLGPLGGSSMAAPQFMRCFGGLRCMEMLRNFSVKRWYWNPWTVASLRSAQVIIAVGNEMAARLAKHGIKAEVMLETALPRLLEEEPPLTPASKRRDFVIAGSLEPWKGWQIALEAFAAATRRGLTGHQLKIVGRGSQYQAAVRLAKTLGISERVEFLGQQSRQSVWDLLEKARALVFSSIRDTSGNVVIEAMGLHCPVICFNHQGVALITDDDGAFRIDPADWAASVSQFADAMLALGTDDDLVDKMGAAGRARVIREFTWERKIERMLGIYQEVCSPMRKKAATPAFHLGMDDIPATAVPQRRLRVLLSAYACEHGRGSEPEVGWQWMLQMLRFHDVTVVTRANNKPNLEKALAALPPHFARPRLVYFDGGPLMLRLKKQFGFTRLYYIWWQKSVRRVVEHLCRTEEFDLLHHITFASYRYVTAVWGHGVPNIWGPVGGMESINVHLLPWLHPVELLLEMGRNLNNYLQITPTAVFPQRAKLSEVTIVSTRETQRCLNEWDHPSVLMPTVALERDAIPFRQNYDIDSSKPLRLLFVGQLIWLKGADLAVEALAASGTNACLHFIGSGRFKKATQKLVRRLGLEERVSFSPHIPRSQVIQELHGHDVFLFPSLHDSGGFAVLEAMASGMPVICLDVGGPAISVADGCGYRVPTGKRAAVIAMLAEKIGYYSTHRGEVEAHGRNARTHVESHFNWIVKGDQMNRLYLEVVRRATKTHDFPSDS